jgi:Spy/CpxP family protein refolding chaperone
MKFWILIFSAALFAGGTCLGVALRPTLAPVPAPPAAAPAPEPWHWRSELSVTRFASELGLTEEQDGELDRILGESQRDVEAYARAMRSSHESTRGKVLAILTPEQKARLDQMIESERKKRAESDLKRAVDAYTKLLALSAEQSKALADALAEAREKRHGDRGRRWDRSASREIRDAQNAKLRAAFTPEQYERFVEMLSLMDR